MTWVRDLRADFSIGEEATKAFGASTDLELAENALR